MGIFGNIFKRDNGGKPWKDTSGVEYGPGAYSDTETGKTYGGFTPIDYVPPAAPPQEQPAPPAGAGSRNGTNTAPGAPQPEAPPPEAPPAPAVEYPAVEEFDMEGATIYGDPGDTLTEPDSMQGATLMPTGGPPGWWIVAGLAVLYLFNEKKN